MRQFKDLENPALLDMLARHTSRYTQLLADNDRSDEFYSCKRLIDRLTVEYENRKKAGKNGNSINLDRGRASFNDRKDTGSVFS